MKLNWGWGLVIAMVLFIAYIMFMVVQAINLDFNLESEDYYSKELQYQEVIDKMANFKALNEKISIEKTNDVLLVDFLDVSVDSGSITLFRPSDDELDQVFPISLQEGRQAVPISDMASGRYIIELDWSHMGEGYYFKKNIVL